MFIKLPIADVDNITDLVLDKKADITYRRAESKKPSKITYTVTFKNLESPPWKIRICQMAGGTEIDFPIYMPSSDVLPSPLASGGTIEVLENEKMPKYDNPIKKAQYELCHSLWVQLKSRERLDNPKDDDKENILPPTVGEIRDLERAAKAGDKDAQKTLAALKERGEYDETSSTIQAIIDALPEKERKAILTGLAYSEDELSELARVAQTPGSAMLEAIDRTTLVPEDILQNFPGLHTEIASLAYIPSPQERTADELAESNRLQREILEELRRKRHDSETEPQAVRKTRKGETYVPSKTSIFKRWQAIWRQVRSQWQSNPNLTKIQKWLEKMHPDISCSVDTLRKIVRAGDEGLLE